MKVHKKLNAFTLAEVLVVIGMIGIIANLTIPGLIADVQEKIMVVRLQKIFLILSQATTQINLECRGNLKNCLTNPDVHDEGPAIELAQLYQNKLKIAENCDNSPGCFASGPYKDTMYTTNIKDTHLYSKFTTNDGYALGIDYHGEWYPEWGLFSFVVDVNGDKGPNEGGRDVFYFGYNPDKKTLEPFGSEYFEQACTPWLSSWNDQGCAAEVIRDGAINY